MPRSLIILVFLMLSVIGCEPHDSFSIASVDAIRPLENESGWQEVETLGTHDGPFRALGGVVLNAGMKKTVAFTVGGTRIEKHLDLDDVEVLLRRFENRQGDSSVKVYQRPATKSP